MRNRFLPFFLVALLSVNFGLAQKCGTYDGYLEKQIQNYPEFYKALEKQNKALEAENKKALKNLSVFKSEDGKKIIPVVVHNIYNGSAGYLTDAQIQDAIDALNRNINGQSDKLLELYNGKYIKTPDIFAAVRGVANVEFRLAKLAPSCDTCAPVPTTGIVRINTEITSLGSDVPDPVKALTYWNSYQYLNIWTVSSFGGDAGGGLLGYAQFPYPNPFQDQYMSTDGVVLKANEMTSTSSTLTHEVGHWLGLRHIWGDAECGDDGVKDTPSHRYDNNGASTTSPTPNDHPKPTPALFPYHVGLAAPAGQTGAWGCVADSLNPAGEMFMNYMDYTRDDYTTMFTAGQMEIVNITFEGELDEETGNTGFGFREYMWSPENVAKTGTSDGYLDIADSCRSKYGFYEYYGRNSICLDVANRFVSSSKLDDLNITKASWDYGDGNVEDAVLQFGLGYRGDHTYESSGTYSVTFLLEYDEVREVRSTDLEDLDPSYDSVLTNLNTLIVQGTQTELNDLGATNVSLHIDTAGYSLDSYWKKNYFTVDSLAGAFDIDTFNFHYFEDTVVIYISDVLSTPDSLLVDIDNGDSIYAYIDGDNLTAQDLLLLQTPENNAADSSSIFISNLYVDYLDSIVEYNFYYDTSIVNIFTFIDSTYLSDSDSTLLNSADSVWFNDGVLTLTDSVSILTLMDSTYLTNSDSILIFTTADSNWVDYGAIVYSTDSIRTHTAQFNDTTNFSFLTYIDSTYLTLSDSIVLSAADSSWVVDSLLVSDSIRVYFAQFNDTTYLNFLTYIDSTYLTPSDSMVLNVSDSSWVINSAIFDLDSTLTYYGIFNHIDSITMYYAQFNDTTITLSINTDTASLSVIDSLMFYDADSAWSENAFVGWVDTVRTFYGSHYYTKYNGYYADTLFYRGNIQDTTYVAYYSSSCVSETVKENFISVGENIASSSDASYTYSFENESELNDDWSLNQSVDLESEWSFYLGEATQWKWKNGVAIDGSSSIMIDSEDLMLGGSAEIISKAYDLSALTNPAIKFSWAGAAVNTFPENALIVTYSDDCGKLWRSLGTINALLASNAGLYTSNFKPNTSEWNDTVMTKNQLQGDNIRFKFEYVISGNTNNFYLDNIQIGEESALMNSNNTINNRLSVFPNPTNGATVIAVENLANIDVEVSVVNILGSKVMELHNGIIEGNYNEISADLSALDKGIYFINITSNGNTIMSDKLILK